MFSVVENAVERLVREHARIAETELDVRFDRPSETWARSLMRPTLNFCLLEMSENTELRQTTFTSNQGNGRSERKLGPRRIELQYLTSVFSTEARDEHDVLWRMLITLMRYSELPPELVPEDLRQLDIPCAARLLNPGERQKLSEIWSALNTPYRPAFVWGLTMPLDLGIRFDAPLVLTRTLKYRFGRCEGTTESPEYISSVRPVQQP